MSPLALMCAMVLAVQAAAVKTSAVESAGAKTLERLTSEVMHGAKNASAMLGELEKMAMSSSSSQDPAPALTTEHVEQIMTILNQAIADHLETRKVVAKSAEDALKSTLRACTNDAADTTKEKGQVDLKRTAYQNCRAHEDTTLGGDGPTTQIHTVCKRLDNALDAVSGAVDALEAAYPTFPSAEEKEDVSPFELKRVGYVKLATNSKVCQAPETGGPIVNQWSDCQGETITNLEIVDAHKDSCLGLQAAFEGAFCEWRGAIRLQLALCENYVNCQKSANIAIVEWNVALAEENAHHTEKLAAKKIKCFLDEWSDSTRSTKEGHDDGHFAKCMEDQTLTPAEITALKIGDATLTADGSWSNEVTVNTNCPVAKYVVGPEGPGTVFPGSSGWEASEYESVGGKDLATREVTTVGTTTLLKKTYTHTVEACSDPSEITPWVAGLLLQAHDSTPIAAKPIAAETPKREKKLVRREPKKAKASLAELDHQGHMTNVKVQASKHSTTELHDMDMDALMELVKTSGANTAAIKAAMTKSIMKLQAQASAV